MRTRALFSDRPGAWHRDGYRNRLQCDILTFITGSSHAGAGG
jgi:hypothetical protein